ncbi:MAG: magnesium/cobalt efflux protein, partial [Gammaproteobacteria bacterium RIFCSPLOWO2_02_FULL_61_13]
MHIDDIPLSLLLGSLGGLILLSAFFSGSETGLMALNRYRLRHLAREGRKSAILAEALLSQPDRLIGLILLGNNLVNNLAVSLATVVALRLVGEVGLFVAPLVFTPLLLIFGEVAPKTMAAVRPERLAFPAAYVFSFLNSPWNPMVWTVWVVNRLANGVLMLFGINISEHGEEAMTREELRTVVMEAGAMIPRKHQRMLLSILDLESIRVVDIMVPRSEIAGIDLNESEEKILSLIDNCQHTRIPVYRDNIDNIVGILHVRNLPRVVGTREEFRKEKLETILREPYFIPMGTQLHKQLIHFQQRRTRIGLVVDEYGVIQGLATLEDLLEEIVGEFTTDLQAFVADIHKEADGSCLVSGSASIRDINKQMNWKLPTDGPRTLNGLILEHLETMPETGTSLRITDYTMEITQTTGNAV